MRTTGQSIAMHHACYNFSLKHTYICGKFFMYVNSICVFASLDRESTKHLYFTTLTNLIRHQEDLKPYLLLKELSHSTHALMVPFALMHTTPSSVEKSRT